MINILLCTEKMDLVAAFYRALKVELVPEKHGNGPDHFSFKGEISMEIYPPRQPPETTIVLRIDVDDIHDAMQSLRTIFGGSDFVVNDVETLSSGQKSIVKDPDGRIVELFQPHRP